MSKRYVILGLALVMALCFALPAVGASPGTLAEALGLAKKAQKQAKKASKRAKSASTQARRAQSTATAAQSAATEAATTAGSARTTAHSAAAAATAARTSASQVYRDLGPNNIATGNTESVATMSNVAPGAYVIMAKTDAYASGNGAGIVQCRVTAGGDSDAANSLLGSGAGATEESVFEAVLEANVVHQFTSPGQIVLSCTNNALGITVSAVQSKIIAIKVGDITRNDAVSG